MERERAEYSKLSEDEDRKLKKVFERAALELPYEFTVKDDTDTVMIKRKTEDGKEVNMGFTKIGDIVNLSDGSTCHFSEVVEARMKYPNESVLSALEKLKKEKEEKTRP